jgi:nitrogen-specific signal transduction histidine kinase
MKDKSEELKLLKEAFNKFVTASDELKSSYISLKERAIKLETELKIVNNKLKISLEEKEYLYSYLKNIIESINVAIIIVDNSNKVSLYNKSAKNLFPKIKKGSAEKCFLKTKFSDIFEISLKNDKEFEKEVKIDDSEYYLFSFGKLKNKQRQIGKFFMIKDISFIKKLEAEVQRNTRLKAMGEMAAELSHEIRNPLGSIKLYASMLEEDLKKMNYNTNYLSFIREEIKKLNSLVSNILLFTREIKPNKRVVNLEIFFNNINNFIKPMLETEGISLKLKLDRKQAFLDSDLFERVFLNLVLNSINALSGINNPKIIIRSFKENKYCILTVEDNGIGIKKELIDKIFNPFFTTKAKGSGLGLSVIYRIIKAHNGEITVESKENMFTKVIIRLKEVDND